MMRPIVPVTKRPETMGSQLDNMIAQTEGITIALRGLVAQITNDIAVSCIVLSCIVLYFILLYCKKIGFIVMHFIV